MNRAIVGSMLLVGALLVGSCSDDAADSPRSTNPPASTTEPTAPEELDAQIDQFNEQVAGADGDFCGLMLSSGSTFDTRPADSAQARKAVEAVATLLNSLAAADGVDDASAQQLTATAQEITAAAEAAEYDPEALSSGQFLQILQDPEFTAVMAGLAQRAASECSTDQTTTTLAS